MILKNDGGDLESQDNEKLTLRQKLERFAHDEGVEFIFFDGFDDALVGWVGGVEVEPRVLYDGGKCLQILEQQGMTRDEALEYFEFNVGTLYAGPTTPIFVWAL